MMTRNSTAAWLATLLIATGGCNDGGKPQVNSNTNWLVACDSDGQCGERSCICGQCTSACNDSTGCDDLPGAHCTPTSGRAVCGTAPATTDACFLVCDTGADCGADADCDDGICVPQAPDSGMTSGDGDGDGDGDTIADAGPVLDAGGTRDAGATPECTLDSDCALLPTNRCCMWCGEPTAADFEAMTTERAAEFDVGQCAAEVCLACVGSPNTRFEAACETDRCVVLDTQL